MAYFILTESWNGTTYGSGGIAEASWDEDAIQKKLAEMEARKSVKAGDENVSLVEAEMPPIDMLLFCPNCGEQHIDLPQPDKDWDNPPHRSHECQSCQWVWRPADVATNGVAEIKTHGKVDRSAKPRCY